MEQSIKERLLTAGVPEKDIRTWCSDLYVRSTETSRAVLETYKYKDNVEPFISRLDNTPWFDIPFANTDYHLKRS